MTLQVYSQDEFPLPYGTKAISAQGVCLYHVYTGRNAWHSTWIQRYNSESMHASLFAAKRYAETLRKAGTVVYIQELPALVVRSKAGCLIATQINTESPLREYKPYIKMESGTPQSREWGLHWLHKESDLRRIADSLQATSSWWRVPPPRQDSVVLLASDDPFEEFGPLDTNPSLFRSLALGGNYTLAWESTDRVLNPEPVQYLERMFSIANSAVFSDGRWND